VQARGQAWVGDAYLSGHTLAHWLYTSLPRDLHPTRAAIQEVLEVLNGCFAFIVETEDAVVAVTDRIRSIPLFYACRGGQYLISDDARRVRDFVGDQVPDELAIRTEEIPSRAHAIATTVSFMETITTHLKRSCIRNWIECG